jgi:nitrogen fixation NifU-like protein
VNSLKQLYRDTIRQHAARPVGFRRPINATHRHEGLNPQCGDRVVVELQISDDLIEDIAFEGEACAICLASASLMCENAKGLELKRFGTLKDNLTTALESRDEPGDIAPLSPLLGVRPYPSRIQCATLPWVTAWRAVVGKEL